MPVRLTSLNHPKLDKIYLFLLRDAQDVKKQS